MRQAVISLILKKNGSYRPLSFLNVDSKILTKILAHRLENVLLSIISSDQTEFIKNRQLFSNICQLLNILYDLTPSDVPDGPKFIHWIKVLYTSPLQRGTRQGHFYSH